MSKTVQEIQNWLLSPSANRVILAEIQNVNVSSALFDTQTIYLSSKAYISNTGINYNPCIVGGISYTEKLNYNGRPSISFGDIELDNTDGANDTYLSYYWNNRSIKLYIGDATWNRTDFSLIFSGIVSDLLSKNRKTLNLVILDTFSRLNTAITDEVLGSGYVSSNNIITGYNGSNQMVDSNKDTIRPLVFGECFNVPALQVATAYYYSGSTYGSLYQVHNGQIENIIEVRDNGAPVDIIPIESDGCFALVNSSYGTITASVQGGYIGSYSSRMADVLRLILTNYGGEYKLSHSNLDFPASSTTPYVGYFCRDKQNVLDVCHKIASSGGYQLVYNTVTAYVGSSTHVAEEGKLKLVQIALPGTPIVYNIEDSDMVQGSMEISELLPTKASIRIGYCKNWTVENDNLAQSINPDNITYYKEEWLPNRYTGSNELYLYKDTTEPEEEETYLIENTQAAAEVQRRFNLFKTKRYIIKAEYFPHMFFAQLGDGVTFNVYHPKFKDIVNSSPGGIIYSIERNWLNNTIKIGVLI